MHGFIDMKKLLKGVIGLFFREAELESFDSASSAEKEQPVATPPLLHDGDIRFDRSEYLLEGEAMSDLVSLYFDDAARVASFWCGASTPPSWGLSEYARDLFIREHLLPLKVHQESGYKDGVSGISDELCSMIFEYGDIGRELRCLYGVAGAEAKSMTAGELREHLDYIDKCKRLDRRRDYLRASMSEGLVKNAHTRARLEFMSVGTQ